MSLFRLRLNSGRIIDLYVVNDFGFGGEQSVIIYESPGSSGGTVLTTGRKNRTVTLNGKLIGRSIQDLNSKKVAIEKARDNGEPLNLDSPLDSEDTGRYIIQSFEGNLPEGQARMITFTLKLAEYRQANIKRASVNLVNFEPAQLLIQRAIDRGFASGTPGA